METNRAVTDGQEPDASLCVGKCPPKLGSLQHANQNPKLRARTESKRVAHYPLDIPLPFERYEHRRLGAADIMVHNIMADFMNPSRLRPSTYGEAIWPPPKSDRILSEDNKLGRDMITLTSMLFTAHKYDQKSGSKFMSQIRGTRRVFHLTMEDEPGSIPPPTYGSQILDLVQRYYFETDDAAVRLLIERLRPPRCALTKDGLKVRHGDTVAGRVALYFEDLVFGQHHQANKTMSPEEVDHLIALRRQVSLQSDLPLYDGGSFLPGLRQPLDRDAHGQRKSRRSGTHIHWALGAFTPNRTAFSFHEERRPLGRFILQAGWEGRVAGSMDKIRHAKLDLCLNTGRGRNTDGIWATGSGETSPKHMTSDQKGLGGRSSRPRRRATSEPPPGAFAVARSPAVGRPNGPVYHFDILYPRITLSQLDRRSRRRSLSRRRVMDMFDWDADLSGVERADSRRTGRARTAVVVDRNVEAEGSLDPKPSPRRSTQPPEKPKARGPCTNCGETSHSVLVCTAPCGHCGAPNPKKLRLPANANILTATAPRERGMDGGGMSSNASDEDSVGIYRHAPQGIGKHNNPHIATTCPVPATSRCKCVPFPTYHVSSRCPVRCSRACGNAHPRGSYQHRNAMMCRSRCCMCGVEEHSGRECRLRRCRCGGAHLGQDCTWKVDCSKPGCSRFRCGMHCQGCGKEARPFVEGKCAACRGEVSEAAPGPVAKGKRRKEKAKKNAEALPKEKDFSREERKIAVQPKKEEDTEIKGGYKSIFGG